VAEHNPDYSKVKQQLLRLLRPGGRVFIDASAFRENHENRGLSRDMSLRAIMPTSACTIFWPRLTIYRWTLWQCITIATIIKEALNKPPRN
jgi:ubiquinone/menaquinone biosynthesis C-methylase UbiE